MIKKTMVRKGIAQRIKAGGLSANQMRNFSHAVSDLQHKSIESLVLTGKARKLNVPNRANVYVYRISPRERMIFSTTRGRNIIHDVIDVDSNQSIIVNTEE